MKQLHMSRIKDSDLEEAFALIETLRQEGAQITFTDYQSLDEIRHWPYSEEHLVYIARDNDSRLLAIVRGKRDNTPEKRHAVFLTAATAAFARGSSIAKSLTEYALDQMKLEGVKIARIYVYSDNHASLKAVSKLGFEKAGVVLAHHLDTTTQCYVDDIIFHKCLD